MYPQAFKFEFGIEGEYLVLHWTRLSDTSHSFALSTYPELEMRFKYGDIASDTVCAMLRNLEVPDQFSEAIMTLIAAQAA